MNKDKTETHTFSESDSSNSFFFKSLLSCSWVDNAERTHKILDLTHERAKLIRRLYILDLITECAVRLHRSLLVRE